MQCKALIFVMSIRGIDRSARMGVACRYLGLPGGNRLVLLADFIKDFEPLEAPQI